MRIGRSVRSLLTPTFIAVLCVANTGQSAAQSFTHQFELDGPFPIEQEAQLRVDEMHLVIGDGWSSGEARFRFRFDVGPCDWLYELDEVSIFSANTPLADCPYEHVVVRELTGISGLALAPYEFNVVLPEEGPARFSRYQGPLLRARVFARELDLFEDDQLGGAIGAFSFRSNFGGGGDPAVSNEGVHGFSLNETAPQMAGNGAFMGDFKIAVDPVSKPANQRLEPWQVWGEDDRCRAGEPFTFGVKMRNPEAMMTGPYAVAIAVLDSDTNTFAEMWTSPALPGMGGPDYQADPTPLTLTLGRGLHRLAVFAPGHANAMELEIRCDFLNTDLPNIAPGVVDEPTNERTSPGVITEPSNERASPGVVAQPTATSTPMPGRTLDPGVRVVQPTATSTPGQLTVPGRGTR